MIPVGMLVPAYKNIEIVKVKKKYDNASFDKLENLFDKSSTPKDHTSIKELKQKKYTVEEKRETNKEAYKPWDDELDSLLKKMFSNGAEISYLAEKFGRTKGAIISRLKKLNIYEDS